MRQRIAGATMWLSGLTLAAALMSGLVPPPRAARASAIPTHRLVEPWRPVARCAQIGPLPCVTPLAPPPSAQTITFNSALDNQTGGTSFSFSGISISAACPNRLVVVGAMGLDITNTNTQDITGTTIGGVTATVVKQATGISTNGSYAGIISAPIPTGSTVTIAFTFTQSISRFTYAVWTVCNVQSTSAKNTASSTQTNPLTMSINTASGDVGVAISETNAGSSAPTWVGITQDFSGTATSNTSGGHFSETATNSPRTITASYGSCNTCAGVSASWH